MAVCVRQQDLRWALRATGIEALGDVPWGTHLCQFYQSEQDLLDTLIPYFTAGLQNNEYCLWIASEPLDVDKAKAALAEAMGDLEPYFTSRQLEILGYREWYLAGGEFVARRVLKAWVDKLFAAQQRGFAGLRLAANTYWLNKSNWSDFTEYERLVQEAIGNHDILAICNYSLDKCGVPEILDVVANHTYALARCGGSWQVVESTERKRSEEALRQSEERFSAAFHAANAGFALLREADGLILDANQAWLDMLGYSWAELVNKPIYALDVFAQAWESAWLQARLRQADSVSIPEILVRRKDGQTRVHSLSLRKVLLQGGRCHLWTAQDITEQVETRQKLEAALATQKELAEERDRSRVELVHLLAHEIRNPMTALKGFAQVIGVKAADGDTRELAAKMSAEVDRLNRMLSQVMDAFRLRSGNLPLDLKVIDLADIVESAVSFYRLEASHSFELSIKHPTMVKGDASRLEDVVRNLLSNAVKYSSPGSEISIRLETQGDYAVLSVRDHGIGIPADEIDQIFTSFFRASNVAFIGSGGAGLGLHLCKHTIENHHGRIRVESRLGCGSTFYVELPSYFCAEPGQKG